MQRPDIETGTVLETEGLWATVITNKSKSCKECGKAQAGICGKSGAGLVMKAQNFAGAEKGDIVELSLDITTHIKAYFLAFVLPVITLLFCTYLGSVISLSVGVTNLDVIAGFTGLILSVVFSFKHIQKLDRTSQLKIIKVLHEPPEYITSLSAEETDYMAAFNKAHQIN